MSIGARLLFGTLAFVLCGAMGVVGELLGRPVTSALLAHAPLPSTLPTLAQQSGAEDCGPAVMSFVALAIGRDVTPAQVARLPESPGLPWSLLDLQRAADALGLDSELLALDRLRAPGWHVLHLPLGARGGHFVAARRVSSTRLQMFDPARGEVRSIDETRLARIWKGHALRIIGERPRM